MRLYDDLVPAAGVAAPDWPLIIETFSWFRNLSRCPQDPVHHGEGDVQIHTRMVVEALLADNTWQQLAPDDRQTVFWAALLHDIAKPSSTRTALDGRVHAPGHARRGQIMAREVLWRLGADFAQRELVCHLITHHQVPFFLIEGNRPERRAHLISHQTRCDLLAIHADADARGRIAADTSRLIENIELFRALCAEENCLDRPHVFPSDHSRFLYFRKPDRAADYPAYDDWGEGVTLMSGLPASGKDTWLLAQDRATPVISLDAIRRELGVAPTASQSPVIVAARERARVHLRAGRPFIWNATNLSRQMRAKVIDLCADYRAKVGIVYVETDPEHLDLRNRARRTPVPDAAMARMLARWEPPDLTECHAFDVILT